jgi:hypothetical protein
VTAKAMYACDHLCMGTSQMLLIPNFDASELSHTEVGFKVLTASGYDVTSCSPVKVNQAPASCCFAYSSTLRMEMTYSSVCTWSVLTFGSETAQIRTRSLGKN